MTSLVQIWLTNRQKGASHDRPQGENEFWSRLSVFYPWIKKWKSSQNLVFALFWTNEKNENRRRFLVFLLSILIQKMNDWMIHGPHRNLFSMLLFFQKKQKTKSTHKMKWADEQLSNDFLRLLADFSKGTNKTPFICNSGYLVFELHAPWQHFWTQIKGLYVSNSSVCFKNNKLHSSFKKTMDSNNCYLSLISHLSVIRSIHKERHVLFVTYLLQLQLPHKLHL